MRVTFAEALLTLLQIVDGSVDDFDTPTQKLLCRLSGVVLSKILPVQREASPVQIYHFPAPIMMTTVCFSLV